MSNKYSKMIIFYVFCLCFIGLIGLSAAFFTSPIQGENTSTIYVKGGNINVKYDNLSNTISVANIYPKEDAWVTKRFKVTGNNTTDLTTFYKVKLVIDNNTFYGDVLSVELNGTNTSNNGQLISEISILSLDKNDVYLGTGYFNKGTGSVHEYELKLYFLDDMGIDQNYAQEAEFAAHLELEIDNHSSEQAPSNWNNTGSNTLLAGIKKYNTLTAPNQSPGTFYSLEDEAVMAAIPDDYGTSYYFRGNVQNNFVSFAGMCWRIVRVTGNGAIKLVLYNNDSSNCTLTGSDLAYAKYDGTNYLTIYNPNGNDNAYGGFMYGTVGASNYNAAQANTNKSVILTRLESWYELKLNNYTNKLADVIWCNDKSTVKNITYTRYIENRDSIMNEYYETEYPGLGYGVSNTFYGSSRRNIGFNDVNYTLGYISSPNGLGPSLVCPNDNNGGKLSKFTVSDTTLGNGKLKYKIGLLTADETIFAGTLYGYTRDNIHSHFSYQDDSVCYLDGNANDYPSWTMTPCEYNVDDGMEVMAYTGEDVTEYVVNYGDSFALRPSIALKADTTISGGNGTASSPFIVN